MPGQAPCLVLVSATPHPVAPISWVQFHPIQVRSSQLEQSHPAAPQPLWVYQTPECSPSSRPSQSWLHPTPWVTTLLCHTKSLGRTLLLPNSQTNSPTLLPEVKLDHSLSRRPSGEFSYTPTPPFLPMPPYLNPHSHSGFILPYSCQTLCLAPPLPLHPASVHAA